ncbi:MAG TPA: sulfatase-like hydrolase/transferase, partial [Chitinophagaceae bacterium]|nr:sulfatase-like hydrolase/transferase [Chitinophagaceae bacterium]
FIENGKVSNSDANDPIAVSYAEPIGEEPTGLSNPELLKQKADTQHSNTIINGISRIGYMTGGKKARWIDEDIALVLNEKAKHSIIDNKDRPFFLYYPFPNIHVPRTPNKRFVGSTKLGARGDVITEMDWMTGEILKLLDSLGLSKNTLIIFSSDNGPVLNDGYDDFAETLAGNHKPTGIFRGGKYSAYEAGTRVPAISFWPGVIKPGVTDCLFSQIDFFASFAKLVNQKIPAGAAPDSENRLAALLGMSKKGRTYMLEESFTLSLRKANWKYISPQEKQTPDWLKNKKIESGLMQTAQLYNLKNDPGEENNLAGQHPEIVIELKEELEKIKKGH